MLRFIFLWCFIHCDALEWSQEKLTLLFPKWWLKTPWRIVFRLVITMPWSVCSNNRRFDGKRATRRKRRPHGTHSESAIALPGVVDCSLAVTNNSPVWRLQGTHSESYPCITQWCSWLCSLQWLITVQFVWWYYSVLPFCKSFHLGKIQASKCRAVLTVSTNIF